MSDQTEDEAHAKRGLAEAEDEGDAKRSKIEQQVPATEVEEDIEARLLRELEELEEEEEKKGQEALRIEEERLNELKQRAQQAEPLTEVKEQPQQSELQKLLLAKANESANRKAEPQTHEVRGPDHQSVWDCIVPQAQNGQEESATVPPAVPLAREAPVVPAPSAAEWQGDVNAWQQQGTKEGAVEQGNEAPIATNGQEATASFQFFPSAREAPVVSAASAAEWHGDANAWQQQGTKEGAVEQGKETATATSQSPFSAEETPANSVARAAEWISSVDALADAHSLDAGSSKESKKPDEVMKESLPKKIVLRFSGSCAPKIVGRAGGSISKVRESTGADVKIKKEPDWCEVTISSSNPGKVQKAKQMVIELAGEQPNA